MKNYLFLGDTHGDLEFTERATALARKHSATIIQLGDWGFIWPAKHTPRKTKLATLSDMLLGEHTTMRFCDGNHDDHPNLRALIGSVRDRGVEIAKNVIYQPRGSVHEDEDGTRFLFLGGAPSIDRALRTAGVSWWPEETITDEEHARALAAQGPIHVLVTHDAPAFPPGFSPKGTLSYQRDQERSMKLVDALINHHRPALHVHGHWHFDYCCVHKTGTTIVGLNCNTTDPAYLDRATLLWSHTNEETP